MASKTEVSGAAEVRSDPVSVRNGTKLALLYQGLLTGIVRLVAGRQHVSDAESFRRKTKTALEQVQREASAAGYDSEDVQDTHLAVVAFLDEVVLNGDDRTRGEWQRITLQQELFGLTNAGVTFFDKLESLIARRDSAALADMLEVYLLCLLLGFQGKYSGGLRGELDTIVDRTRRRIERIRGRTSQISPAAALPSEEPDPAPAARTPRFKNVEVAAACTILATLLLFVCLKLNLTWVSEQVTASFGTR